MSRAVLKVVFAGPYISVQDAGRTGYMRFGVTRSGPMDRLGFAAANLALGNPAGASGIEVSLGGLTLECVEGEVGFAIAGGDFVCEIDGKDTGSWQRHILRAGQRLVIRPGRWGAWTYLALAGALQSREWLGSAATHMMSGFGGGAIRTGQILTVEDSRVPAPLDLPRPVFARHKGRLKVVMGPQDHFFSGAVRESFLESHWQLTPSYDRMGMRLAGPNIAPEAALDMPSEGIARGAVQVAGDGAPVILQADHQTTGGYPKIATVLNCQLDGFAQGRPGAWIGFEAVTPQQGVLIARSRHLAVERYLTGIKRIAAN